MAARVVHQWSENPQGYGVRRKAPLWTCGIDFERLSRVSSGTIESGTSFGIPSPKACKSASVQLATRLRTLMHCQRFELRR
jgi:hypothetical protein